VVTASGFPEGAWLRETCKMIKPLKTYKKHDITRTSNGSGAGCVYFVRCSASPSDLVVFVVASSSVVQVRFWFGGFCGRFVLQLFRFDCLVWWFLWSFRSSAIQASFFCLVVSFLWFGGFGGHLAFYLVRFVSLVWWLLWSIRLSVFQVRRLSGLVAFVVVSSSSCSDSPFWFGGFCGRLVFQLFRFVSLVWWLLWSLRLSVV